MKARLQEKLQASEHMLGKLLDTVPVSIFWKDRDSIYVGCNAKCAADCGLDSPAKIIGLTDHDLSWKAFAEKYRADDIKVLETKESILGYNEKYFDASGRERWVETSKVPLFNGESEPIGILGLYRDITEQKEREKQLYDNAMELERSNNTLEKFAYIASHDLKTPARHIRQYAELLGLETSKATDLSDKAKHYIASIQSSAATMIDLIESILTFARVGQDDEKFISVNLNKLIANVFALLKEAYAHHACKLELMTGDIGNVYGDYTLLHQVFTNIVENAIKFNMRQDRVIDITSEIEGDNSHIVIQDNGPGIPPEHVGRVFEPFYRYHDNNIPGSGIGLSICQKIISYHKGKIWIETNLGIGTKMHIVLPRG